MNNILFKWLFQIDTPGLAEQPGLTFVNTGCHLEDLPGPINDCCNDKRVHTFQKGICPEGNVIAEIEFELTTMSQSHMLAITLRRLIPYIFVLFL